MSLVMLGFPAFAILKQHIIIAVLFSFTQPKRADCRRLKIAWTFRMVNVFQVCDSKSNSCFRVIFFQENFLSDIYEKVLSLLK
jgi:hypothetical protein